ncbi:hypothetical protein GALMADRAFT_258348 [Galerina marginata CBS 339.88]|uniref:Uncharacterized protein n=1 Tax=Galerina marginata (strain CBS 339.88) TaxID=685588 RepID=A0A067SKV9_GALM3|nr:hypothetical protein GALMADRAFT_258348 [Galerina marginata CBS 339.88]
MAGDIDVAALVAIASKNVNGWGAKSAVPAVETVNSGVQSKNSADAQRSVPHWR